MNRELHWHIFCRVIDNFGDIGVCWRLARQLVQDHKIAVTLWVDDLTSFHTFWPSVDKQLSLQICEGVRIGHWVEPFPCTTPGDVVIEAFGCTLPSHYLRAMTKSKPVWLNLEYLSAEDWVKDYHLNVSPVNGLTKTFFFPGFEADTGGLLWDAALIELAGRMNSPEARNEYLQQLGLRSLAQDQLLMSLFSYENAALPELLDALSQHAKPVTLFVPEGRMGAGVALWLGQKLAPGTCIQKGQLTLVGLAFMDQDSYDRLLALCDLNFVRGEESFVRTQMLAKPFIWHIYPQDEEAHLLKLDAFLARYLDGAPAALAQTYREAALAWNQPSLASKSYWEALLNQLPTLAEHSQSWRSKLVQHGDLASNIVHFCGNQV